MVILILILHLSHLTFCSSHFAMVWPLWPFLCDQGHSAMSVLSVHPWKAVGEQHAPPALHLQNDDAARVLQ